MSGKTAYEVNIWDDRPEQKYGTGAIVDVGAVDPMPHAGGKWNVYEITAKGDTFTVVLNGQKTVDGAKAGKFAAGHIALQHGKGASDESGVVKFRKVEIKPLQASNRLQQQPDDFRRNIARPVPTGLWRRPRRAGTASR